MLPQIKALVLLRNHKMAQQLTSWANKTDLPLPCVSISVLFNHDIILSSNKRKYTYFSFDLRVDVGWWGDGWHVALYRKLSTGFNAVVSWFYETFELSAELQIIQTTDHVEPSHYSPNAKDRFCFIFLLLQLFETLKTNLGIPTCIFLNLSLLSYLRLTNNLNMFECFLITGP